MNLDGVYVPLDSALGCFLGFPFLKENRTNKRVINFLSIVLKHGLAGNSLERIVIGRMYRQGPTHTLAYENRCMEVHTHAHTSTRKCTHKISRWFKEDLS